MARYIVTINSRYFMRVYGTKSLYKVRKDTKFWSKAYGFGWSPADFILKKGDYFFLLDGYSGRWQILVSTPQCEGIKIFGKCDPDRFGR